MARKKVGRKKTIDHQLLIFEITDWEPSYSFSLNRMADREGDYSEYAELHLKTMCVYPEACSGRAASMIFSSRRGLFDPIDPRRESFEVPNNVGLLNLPPSGGSFYGGVPHETVPYLLAGLAAERFRFVMIAGPSLKRGDNLSTEIHFSRTSD